MPRNGSWSPTSACRPSPARTGSPSLPARSIRPMPLANTELTLLARNNEVLGTATTDADGKATFTAGLMRGAGGMVPAVLTAKSGDGDFVFLDMTRAGFDLSDRGVTGRAAPGAIDVYAWTERGIYRAGETVHAAALTRDDSAQAVENLPLTFIFTRPDGVEARRIVARDDGLGGHSVDFDLEPTAMRGTWTVAMYTDPDQPARRRAAFPGRGLRARPHRVRPDFGHQADRGGRHGRHERRRPLPLRRAGLRPEPRGRAAPVDGALARRLPRLRLRARRRIRRRHHHHDAAGRPPRNGRRRQGELRGARRRGARDHPPARRPGRRAHARGRPAAPSSARSTCPSRLAGFDDRHPPGIFRRRAARGLDRVVPHHRG